MSKIIKKLLLILIMQIPALLSADEIHVSNYFHRTLVHTYVNNHIVLIDNSSPRMITLDPWPELVISLADGKHSIQELIDHIGSSYKGAPPSDYKKTIMSVVLSLKNAGYIRITTGKYELPYYLAIPHNEQNKIKSKELMLKDGYIK